MSERPYAPVLGTRYRELPTRCLHLNESCWPKKLYRKNYGDENGSKSFQQQGKMFCREFGWPSMKVLQIKVGGRKLFGRSLKLLANVQCLRQGSEVCNWYQLANSPSLQSRRILPCDRFGLSTDRALGRVKKWFITIKRLLWGYNSLVWRRRSTVDSAFYPFPAFYSQSAVRILQSVCILPLVRSLQSAVRSPRLTLTVMSCVTWKNRFRLDCVT